MIETLGKYEILGLLGKGTMGEVYLARDPFLDRKVALKTIRSGSAFAGEDKARFEREARAMAALNHPSIVTVYDFGTVGETFYLAMEYLEGEDLAAVIRGGSTSKVDLLEALAQVCDGLGYTHSHGIVHRDVKPANILVATRGRALVAKLLDFGVAAVDRSSLTEQGTWMGTVGYMAPEYLESGKASPSADLFAAGVILYEILSGGQRPFPGDNPTAILGAILHKPARELAPADTQGVPPAVLKVLDRAMAKDPAGRFATGEDLADALREALATPLEAEPAETRRIVVGKGGGANCLSLRVALRQAKPGDLIEVLPGLYKEALLVDKALTLQGAGDPSDIVVEAPSGPCLTIDAPQCVVRGLTFQGGDPGPALELRSGLTSLVSCGVSNPAGVGLRVGPGAQVEAQDAHFEGEAGGSVELGPGSVSRFERCRFGHSRAAGVLVLEGARTTLEGCLLSGHLGAGLHAMAGAQVQMNACRMVDNQGLGLSLVDGARGVLDRCELSSNGEAGLLLHRGGSARMTHCRVTNGKSLGIACHREATLAMDHTEVRGNALGGLLLGPGAAAPDLGAGNELADAVLQ